MGELAAATGTQDVLSLAQERTIHQVEVLQLRRLVQTSRTPLLLLQLSGTGTLSLLLLARSSVVNVVVEWPFSNRIPVVSLADHL